MTKKNSFFSDGLDMLLDTMCNTFGGVCFIALMVAILSAMMPHTPDRTEADEGKSLQLLLDEELQRLVRRRDELKVAVARHRDFVMSNAVQEIGINLADLSRSISSNGAAIVRLEAEKLELEDKLAKYSTEQNYSRREASRLERLLKEMNERLGRVHDLRVRAVRTPTERELSELHSEDIWLRHGKLYLVWRSSQVTVNEEKGDNGKMRWQCRLVPESGYIVNEAFFMGTEWAGIKRRLDGKGFARIFSDKESFAQLCELRDALIHFGKMYNWYIREDDVLLFKEGYDGRIQ